MKKEMVISRDIKGQLWNLLKNRRKIKLSELFALAYNNFLILADETNEILSELIKEGKVSIERSGNETIIRIVKNT